jgi:arsenate reductase (glutaredoxin)
MNMTIYHNPRCSKSRRTLELMREHGVEPRIVEYLRSPPDKAAILEIAQRLGTPVEALLRKNEGEYRESAHGLAADDDEAIAEWLARHPQALQRPVVVDEDRGAAVIGRPPENVLDLLQRPPK